MKMLQSNKSKLLAMAALILLGLFSLTLFAQEKEETKSKLDQLKGKVEKITVKVDGKDVVFDGKDAQKLADRLRAEKRIRIFTSGDAEEGEVGEGNAVFFRSREGKVGTSEMNEGNISKNVKVEEKDGKKVVTVTTTKDGKDETKVYEGAEAEKFLKDEKGMKHISVTLNDDEDMPKGNMVYFNKRMNHGKMGMRNCCCCCNNGCEMDDETPMHGGKKIKKMIIKETEDDDRNAVEKKIEKKIEKK